MQINNQALEKKAVEAALQQNWKEAIQINLEILEKSPEDKDAKIRLGRAYLHTKDYTRAKKLFKEVLAVDPINTIAQKNYALASEKAKVKEIEIVDGKSLLKEPGKTKQVELPLETTPARVKVLLTGDFVDLKINKITTSVLNHKGEKIATIQGEIANKLFNAKKDGHNCTANIVRVDPVEKTITLLIKCSATIFKGDKQTEKPYMKSSILDEPELELPEEEE